MRFPQQPIALKLIIHCAGLLRLVIATITAHHRRAAPEHAPRRRALYSAGDRFHYQGAVVRRMGARHPSDGRRLTCWQQCPFTLILIFYLKHLFCLSGWYCWLLKSYEVVKIFNEADNANPDASAAYFCVSKWNPESGMAIK